jgi:hypothetical protein
LPTNLTCNSTTSMISPIHQSNENKSSLKGS